MESYLGNHRPYYPQGLPTTSGEASTSTTYSASPSPSHYPLYHGINPHHPLPSPATPNHSAAMSITRKAPQQYAGELQYSQHNPRQFSSPPCSSQHTRPISDPYLMRHNSLQHAAPYVPPHSRPPDAQGSSSRTSGTRCLEVTRVGPAHTFSSISPIESGQIITSRPNIAHSTVTNSLGMDYRLSDSRYLDHHRSPSYSVSSSSRSGSSSLGRGHSLKSGNQHPPTLIKAEEPTTLSVAHLQLHRSLQQPHTKEKRFETATAPVPYAVAKRAEDPYYNDKLEESYACIKKVENPYAINNMSASSSRSSSGEVEIKRQRNEAYSGVRNQHLVNAHSNEYSQLNGSRESWLSNAGVVPQTSRKVEKYGENKSDLVLDLSVKTVRQTADSTAPEPEVMASTSGTPSLSNIYGSYPSSKKNSPYMCASTANEEATGTYKAGSNETEFHRYSSVNSIAPNFGNLLSQDSNGMISVARYSPNMSSKRPSDSPSNPTNKISKLDSTFAQQQYLSSSSNSRYDKDKSTGLEPYPPTVKTETTPLLYPGITDKTVHDSRVSSDPYKLWNSYIDKSKSLYTHGYVKPENGQPNAVDLVPDILPIVTTDSKFYQPDVRTLYQNVSQTLPNASNYLHPSHYYNYPNQYPGIQPPHSASSTKEKQTSHSYYNSYGNYGTENQIKNAPTLELTKQNKEETDQSFEHYREIRVKTESEINNSCLPSHRFPYPSSSCNSAQNSAKYFSPAIAPAGLQCLDGSSNDALILMPHDQTRPPLQDSAHTHTLHNANDRNVYTDSFSYDIYPNQCRKSPSSLPTSNSEVPMGIHLYNHKEQCKSEAVPSSHSSSSSASFEPCIATSSAIPVSNGSNESVNNLSIDFPKRINEIISEPSESCKNLKESNSTNQQTKLQSQLDSCTSSIGSKQSQQDSCMLSESQCDGGPKLECLVSPIDADPKFEMTEKDCKNGISKPNTSTSKETNLHCTNVLTNMTEVTPQPIERPLCTKSVDDSKTDVLNNEDKKLLMEKSSLKSESIKLNSTIPVSTSEINSSHIASNELNDCVNSHINSSSLNLIINKSLHETNSPSEAVTFVKAEEKSKVPMMGEQNKSSAVSLNIEDQKNLTTMLNKNSSEVLHDSSKSSESSKQLIAKNLENKPIPENSVENDKANIDIKITSTEVKPEKHSITNQPEMKVSNDILFYGPLIPMLPCISEENSGVAINKISGSENMNNNICESKTLINKNNEVVMSNSVMGNLNLFESKPQISDSLSIVNKPVDTTIEKCESQKNNASICKIGTICDSQMANNVETNCKVLTVDKVTSEIQVVDSVNIPPYDDKVLIHNVEKDENLVTSIIKPATSEILTIDEEKSTVTKTADVIPTKTSDFEDKPVKDINLDVSKVCQESLYNGGKFKNSMEKNKNLVGEVNEMKEGKASIEGKENVILNYESSLGNLSQDCLNKNITETLEVKTAEILFSDRKEIQENGIVGVNEATKGMKDNETKDLVINGNDIKQNREPCETESSTESNKTNVNNLSNALNVSGAKNLVDSTVKGEENLIIQESKEILNDNKLIFKSSSYGNEEIINKECKTLESQTINMHDTKEKGNDKKTDLIEEPKTKEAVHFEVKNAEVKEPLSKNDDIEKYTTNIIKQRLLGPSGTDKESDFNIASKSTIDHNITVTTSHDTSSKNCNEEAQNTSLVTSNCGNRKSEEESEIRNKGNLLFDAGNNMAKELIVDPSVSLGGLQEGSSLLRNVQELETSRLPSKLISSTHHSNSFQSPWQPVMPYSIPPDNAPSQAHKLFPSSGIGNQAIDRSIQDRPRNNKNEPTTNINVKQVHQTKDPIVKSYLPPPHSHLDPYLASRSPFAARPHPAHSVPVLSGQLNPPPSHSAPPHSAHSGKTATQQSNTLTVPSNESITSTFPSYHNFDSREYRHPLHMLQPTVPPSSISTTYNPSLTITTVSAAEQYNSEVPTRLVRSPHSPTHPPPTSSNSHLYTPRVYSQPYQEATTLANSPQYNYMASKPTYTQGNSYVTSAYSSSSVNKTHSSPLTSSIPQPIYQDMQSPQSSHESSLSTKHAYQYPNFQNSYSNQLQNPYHPSYKYPNFLPSKDNLSYPPISKAGPYSQSIPSQKLKSQSMPPVSYPNHVSQQQSYSNIGNNPYTLNNYSTSLNLTTQTSNGNKPNSISYPSCPSSTSQPSINPPHLISTASQPLLNQHHLTSPGCRPSAGNQYSASLPPSYNYPLVQLRQSETEFPNYSQMKPNTTTANSSIPSVAYSQASRYETKSHLITQTSPTSYPQNYSQLSRQSPVHGYHSSDSSHSYPYQTSQHQAIQPYSSIQSPHASQSSVASGYHSSSRTLTMSPRGSRASTPHSNSQSPRNLSPHPSRYPSPSSREFQPVSSHPLSAVKEARLSSSHTSNQSAFATKDQMQPANLSYKSSVMHDNLNPQIYGNPSVVDPSTLTRSSPIQQPPLNLSSNSNQLKCNTDQSKSVPSPFQVPSQPCLPARIQVSASFSHVTSSASSLSFTNNKSSQPNSNTYPSNVVSETRNSTIPQAHIKGKTEISKLENYNMYHQGDIKPLPYTNNQTQQLSKDFSPYQSSPAIAYSKLPVTSLSDQHPLPLQMDSSNAESHHYPSQPRYSAPNAHYPCGSNQHLSKLPPPSNSYSNQSNLSLYNNSHVSKHVTQSNYQYSPPASHSSSQYTSPQMNKTPSSSQSLQQCNKPTNSNISYHSAPPPAGKSSIPVPNYSSSHFNSYTMQQSNKNTTTAHANYDKSYPRYQSQHPHQSMSPLPSSSVHKSSLKHSTPSTTNQYPILPAHSNISKTTHSVVVCSFQSTGNTPCSSTYTNPVSTCSTSKPIFSHQYSNSMNHLNRPIFHSNELPAHLHHSPSYSRQSTSPFNKEIGIRLPAPASHTSQSGLSLLPTNEIAQHTYPKPAHSNNLQSHYNYGYHEKQGLNYFSELTASNSLKTHSPSLSIIKDLQKDVEHQLHTEIKSDNEVIVSEKSHMISSKENKVEKVSLKSAEPGKAALVEKLQKKLIKKESFESETSKDNSINLDDEQIDDFDFKFLKLMEDLETNKDTVTSKKSCIVTKRYIQKLQLQNAADNNEELVPIPYTEDDDTESEREEPIKKFRGKFRSIKDKAVERVILTYASHSDESATEMIPDDDASDFEEELIKEIEAKARKGRLKLKNERLKEVRKKYSSDERSPAKSKRKTENDMKTRRSTRKQDKDFYLSSSEDLFSSSDSRESTSSDDSNSDSSLDSVSASENETQKRKKKSKLARKQRKDDSESDTSNSEEKLPSRRNARKLLKSSSEEANYIPKTSKMKRKGKHHLKKELISQNLKKGIKRKNKVDRQPTKRRVLMRKQGDLESDSDEPMKEVAKNFKFVKRKRQVTSSESDGSTENKSNDGHIKDEFDSDNDSEVKFVLHNKEKKIDEIIYSDFEETEEHEEPKICADKFTVDQQEAETCENSVILKLKGERQGELNREDVIEMKLWQQKVSLEMEKLLDNLPEIRTRHSWKKPNFVEEFKKGWQEDVKKYKINSARIPKSLISTPPLPSSTSSQGQGMDKGGNQKKTKDVKKSDKAKEAGSPSPAKNTRSKSGIIKTSMAVAEKNYLKVATRPGMSSFMQNFFEKVMGNTVANESKKFQPFAPFMHTRMRTPTGLTPTPSVALSMMASDDSDRDSLASLRTDLPASDSVPVARRSSIANSLIKKLKKKYAKKVDTQWLNKSRSLLEVTNEPQLLPTPGLSTFSSNLSSTPYDSFKMKTFFRKDSINRYRENFDQVLPNSVINELTPVIVPSRTRNKAKAILDAATIKSVFGEELSQLKTVKDDSITKKKISPNLFKKKKDAIVTTVRDSPIPSSLSLSSTPTEYLYNDDYDSELRSERSESTLRELAILQDIKKSGRKLRKYRKFRSGFDYIRKKKKNKTEEENSVQTIKKKMPARKRVMWPEESRDVANEIRSWVINKGLGETILHKAARLVYHDVVIYCLESGDFNINTKDNAGYTPLHEACNRGHLDIAQSLCAHGAHVNASGFGGMRPLHEAIENGHIELARLLLAYGADPSLATYGGQSCLALASDPQAEKFLQDYLGDVRGKPTQKWFISGPASIFDHVNQGISIFSNVPKDKIRETPVLASNCKEFEGYENASLDPCNNNSRKTNANEICFIESENDFNKAKLESESDEIVFESSARLLPNIYDISGRSDCYVLLRELLETLALTKKELIMSAGGIETLHLSFEEFEMNAKSHIIGYESSKNHSDKIVMVKYTSQVKNLFDIEYTCV